jgi:protein-S-isoprenylcysteine O-methyltransferase Ste14
MTIVTKDAWPLRLVHSGGVGETQGMTVTRLWMYLYWLWIAVEVYVVFTARLRRGGSTGVTTADRGSMMVLWVVIGGSISAGFWVAAAYEPAAIHAGPWLRAVSLALLATGLLVRVTAIYTLGRSFTANVSIHATQTLNRSGLFRYLRHPSYTGMLLIFLALGLRLQNWLSLAIVLLPPFAALLYRIHVEEAALTEAFGEQYVDYSRTTKRLVPGIY